MNIIERVKNILITPKTEWNVIDAEPATMSSIFTGYVLPLAVIGSAGTLLQGLLFAGLLGITYFMVGTAITIIASLVSFFVTTIIIDALAPGFGSEKNMNKSAQLVAYSWTPSYLAGLLSFIPILGWLLALAAWVYSIYLMYLGMGPLKKTPEDKKVVYLIVSFVIMIALYFIVVAILGLLLYAALGVGSISGIRRHY